MKYLLILSFLPVSTFLIAQKNGSFQQLESDFCNNLNRQPQIIFNSAEYEQNLLKLLENYQPLMIKMGKEKYGNSKVDPKVFFEYFYQKLALSMIGSCKTFYRLADSLRINYYSNRDKNALRNELAMRKKMDRRLSGNYFWYRAEVYWRLGDYKNALIDVDSSIVDKPRDSRGYVLKGWMKERSGNFLMALQLYEKADIVTPAFENKFAAAIVKRKLKEKSEAAGR